MTGVLTCCTIVSNLMIDDNWQTLAGRNYGSSGTWSSFEANEKFPGGLKGLVSKLRAKFPYLKHIGVWHALHGYWDGITPDSALGKEYKTVEVAWRDNVNSVDKMLTMIAPEDVERFYDDFYRFLSECGIDSVKTDVQCRIDELVHGKDKAKLGRAYLDAFKKSGIKYFDQRVIYCMAHVPQILYHALLPDDNRRVFFRTSDGLLSLLICGEYFLILIFVLRLLPECFRESCMAYICKRHEHGSLQSTSYPPRLVSQPIRYFSTL